MSTPFTNQVIQRLSSKNRAKTLAGSYQQGYGLGTGGCEKLCPVAMGLSLVTLFSLSMSIEDHPLLWMIVRS
jgi:hypothetical protein